MTANRRRQTFPLSRFALVLGLNLILSTVAAGQPATTGGLAKWSFDELTLTNGAKFQGLILSESTEGIRFQSVSQPPGRPTVTLTSFFTKAEIAAVKRLSEADRMVLKERLAELDPSGAGERKPDGIARTGHGQLAGEAGRGQALRIGLLHAPLDRVGRIDAPIRGPARTDLCRVRSLPSADRPRWPAHPDHARHRRRGIQGPSRPARQGRFAEPGGLRPGQQSRFVRDAN